MGAGARGGKTFHRNTHLKAFTWWSITKERPQQKPPIEATEFSMLALIKSMSSICTNMRHKYVVSPHRKNQTRPKRRWSVSEDSSGLQYNTRTESFLRPVIKHLNISCMKVQIESTYFDSKVLRDPSAMLSQHTERHALLQENSHLILVF